MRTVEPLHAWRAVRGRHQTHGRRVGTRSTLSRSTASHRTVVARRAYVVLRRVHHLSARVPRVTYQVRRRLRSALEKSSHRTATPTEVTSQTGSRWHRQASGRTILASTARSALLDGLQSQCRTECAVRTQILRPITSTLRTVRSGRALHRRWRTSNTVRSLRTCLASVVASLVLESAGRASNRNSTTHRTHVTQRTYQRIIE